MEGVEGGGHEGLNRCFPTAGASPACYTQQHQWWLGELVEVGGRGWNTYTLHMKVTSFRPGEFAGLGGKGNSRPQALQVKLLGDSVGRTFGAFCSLFIYYFSL